MKIVHIITSLHGGGRERRLVQLSKGLSADTNIKQYILILSPEIDYPEASNYAQIIQLQNSSRIVLFKSLTDKLLEIKPDIVHDWTGISLILTTLSIMKYRLKFKYIEGFIADGNPLKTALSRITVRISFIVADAIISNSRAGLSAKHAPLSKSHVFYNGFDFNRIKNITKNDIIEFRQELGLSDQTKIISMLARHNPAKDWGTFLDVAQEMQKTHDDIVFLSVGKGSDLASFNNDIRRRALNNVKSLGFRHDAERIIAASYLTLLFSNEKVHAEGVSNSIMESMAAGVPVIASNGGGTPEIITDTEDSYIIMPGDTMTAVSRINNLLSDERLYKTISSKAVTKIHNNFDISLMIDKYQKLYYQITTI